MRDFIPYGKQCINEDDIQAVIDVLRSDWLTTGPMIDQFEKAIASYVGVGHGVAVSSGTAALHLAMMALDIGPGDEVIVPPMTFAATSNAVLYVGGTPVFADVDPDTLLICPDAVEKCITPRTRAIVAVDYAGQPCDYQSLKTLVDRHGLFLVADACHSLGASDQGEMCGTLADLSVFSFHPVKPLTTAEGGMVVTDSADLAQRVRVLRNHGISTDHRQRSEQGVWFYEMTELGFNYRLSDLQCALGASQLDRLPLWIKKRQQIAVAYDAAFRNTTIRPLNLRPGVSHGYHLYVVRVPERDRVFDLMRQSGIGVNLHYVPVYLHPFYRRHLGTEEGLCPVAEQAYGEILSLPIYPAMEQGDIDRVIGVLQSLDS